MQFTFRRCVLFWKRKKDRFAQISRKATFFMNSSWILFASRAMRLTPKSPNAINISTTVPSGPGALPVDLHFKIFLTSSSKITLPPLFLDVCLFLLLTLKRSHTCMYSYHLLLQYSWLQQASTQSSIELYRIFSEDSFQSLNFSTTRVFLCRLTKVSDTPIQHSVSVDRRTSFLLLFISFISGFQASSIFDWLCP